MPTAFQTDDGKLLPCIVEMNIVELLSLATGTPSAADDSIFALERLRAAQHCQKLADMNSDHSKEV